MDSSTYFHVIAPFSRPEQCRINDLTLKQALVELITDIKPYMYCVITMYWSSKEIKMSVGQLARP